MSVLLHFLEEVADCLFFVGRFNTREPTSPSANPAIMRLK